MFNELLKFEKERTKIQAFGFYLACMALGILTTILLGIMLNLSLPLTGLQASWNAGVVVAMILSPVLYFVVLSKKNRLDSFGLIGLGICTPILAFIAGYTLSLIPIAYLTTLGRNPPPLKTE